MADVPSQITGTVWKIEVTVGQQVAVGDVLVILESMKMEIPVTAPVAGRVSELRVAAEDTVQEGDVVAVIDEG